MAEVAAKVAPSTLKERTAALDALAGHIDEVTRGLPLAPVDYTPVLIGLMGRAPIEARVIERFGFTRAWMEAVMPHLASVIEFTGPEYKPRVELGMGVGFEIPEAFRYVDEEWIAL